MDVLTVTSVGAAESIRPAGGRARAHDGPAFGSALDSAMTKKAAASDRAREAERDREAAKAAEAREDDERAAEQAALWMTAARAARTAGPRPAKPAGGNTVAAEGAEAAATEGSADAAAADAAGPPLPVAGGEALARAADAVAAAEEAAAAEASTKATAGRAAARSTDATDVERSLEALDPAFRARLERVIERMESAGHDVTVTETHRDGDRQNYLYEQGRTRSGPVVTWTRNSNHTRGLAADLVVDGTYDNPAGYAKLARIAAEEGLRTLGARDQGHVEMTGTAGIQAPRFAVPSAQQAARQTPAAVAELQAQLTPVAGGIAQVAQVAQVAATAQVAQVAHVAHVAQPGSWAVRMPEGMTTAQATDAASAATASADASAVAREAVRGFAAASVNAFGGSGQRGRGAADEESTTSSGDADLGSFVAETGEGMSFAAGTGTGGGRTQPAGGVAATLRADVAGRMERVLALQDAAANQPLSHVSVRLDGDDGAATRVHVGLRGSVVGAAIDTADPLAAASLRAHVAELRQALEQQGLDPSALLVRAAAKPAESLDASRLLASLAKADPTLATLATGTARDANAQRDSAGQGQSHNQPARRDPDAQRQRHSRNGKEDRP